MRWIGVALALAVGLIPAAAAAQGEEAREEPAPFRGTGLTLRSLATALTFAPGAEPDYNPTVEMGVDAALVWWFLDDWSLALQGGLDRELTRSDSTTGAGEVVPGDVSLTLGGSGLVKIPVLEIDLSASLGLQAPTSPSSQARTLLLGISPGVSARRGFDVLDGLSVGYGARGSYFAHRLTTSERQSPLIDDCALATGGCEPFLNLGVRNVEARLSHSADLSLGVGGGLGLSAGVTLINDFLYDGVEDERVSFTPQEVEDERFSVVTTAALSWAPMAAAQLRLGVVTAGSQRAPDQSLNNPFFNRNTAIFIDLGLDLAGLVSQVSGD